MQAKSFYHPEERRLRMDNDSVSPAPGTTWNRRQFMTSLLASGFALAVQPVTAATITTDSKGLTAGEVKVPATDTTVPAYRAMPAKGGPFPIILVVPEIFGVHEHIKDVCRRLAKQRYLAIAPELFFRQGDVSQISEVNEIVSKVVSKVPDAQVLSDLDAAARWAAANSGDAARLGITGFCYGGRITWLYCAHNDKVKAGVAWYGRLTSPVTELQPKHPLDIAKELKAPVLGLYGGKDQGIPLDTVEEMRTRLSGSKSEIVVYPDAPHAFNADYRPSYREDAAKDGWAKMLEWFRRHGVA
jgi:carboxymethylenebutenolidase